MAVNSTTFADTFNFLEWLEKDWQLEDPLKAQIQNLKVKAKFLVVFFGCRGKWLIDDNNDLKVILEQIEIVVLSSDQDLQLLWLNLMQNLSRNDESLPQNLDSLIVSASKKLDLIKPLIQELYAVVSKSTRSFSSTINDILELIKALLSYLRNLKAYLIVTPHKKIQVLEDDLWDLAGLFWSTKQWSTGHEKLRKVLIRAEAVVDNLLCLLHLLYSDDNKMDEHLLNELELELSYQQERIKGIKADAGKIYLQIRHNDYRSYFLAGTKHLETRYLLVDELAAFDALLGKTAEVSDVSASFRTSVADQIGAMHKEVKIVRDYLLDTSAHLYTKKYPEVNNLFLHIKLVVSEAARVIRSIIDNHIDEDIARQLLLRISDLLQVFKVIKRKAIGIYHRISDKYERGNFPKTNQMGFVDFVIENLKQLLNSKDDSIAMSHHQIETVYGNILSLRGDFFETADHHMREHEKKQKGPWTRFVDIVYYTQYFVDSLILGKDSRKPLWYYKLGLFNCIEEIKIISRKVNDINNKSTNHTAGLKLPSESGDALSSGNFELLLARNYNKSNEAKKLVDYVELFWDEAEKIAGQLTNSSTHLQILSVVGMPGIGKTTLTYSIYENHDQHFHVRARCCVTQAYQKRRLLLEILGQVSELTNQGDGMSDDDLATKIYQSLKGKKYLILFDDLWDIRPWNDMRLSFPDDDMGSRIMFTSRFQDIASQIESNCISYALNPISDFRSWELLQLKLFKNESFPEELSEVGQKIAANCKGLPIAVDLIAGLLRMKDRRKECWEQVANSLSTHLLQDQQGRCMDILELSYNDLPNHLKPCFLYFGAFPNVIEVPTCKLMWLWIAEGFVQLKEDDKGSLQEAAEKYLNDLIARSLVTNYKRGSRGGVKASRVHDLLHDFALAKAKEECFLQQTGNHIGSTFVCREVYESYRLCIHSGWDSFAASNPSGPFVHSLVLSGNLIRKVSFNFSKFNLLRVLDIWAVDIDYSPSIFKLVHLRFLSLSNYRRKTIPPEIGNLQNLETFLLRSYLKISLPMTIWKLVRLRHFMIRGSYNMPQYSPEFLEKTFNFESLQSLSTPNLCYGEDTEKIMRCFTNLQRLSCKFLDSLDCSSNCYRFPILDFLTGLQSLKVVCKVDLVHRMHPCMFNFPQNLKKLTMSKFHLPWSEISTIGKLPNLEVLKLLTGAFEGKVWNMTEGEFLHLKFLKLEELDIAKWNAYEDHLPCLETLVLSKCNRIQEIPPYIGDILTLHRIELRGCHESARNSAGVIKEKQEEMGNVEFMVTLI